MQTQRFSLALATDGDVTAKELREALDALGYHGILVHEHTGAHECPCPSSACLDLLDRQGHFVPPGTDCCICWAISR